MFGYTYGGVEVIGNYAVYLDGAPITREDVKKYAEHLAPSPNVP